MYEWLKDYQQIEDEITYLEQNLNRSKKELKRWMHGDLAKYKLTAESDGARLEDKIAVIEYELAHKLNDLYDLDQLVKKFNGIEQKIIYGKYIEGKTLEHVAEDLGYSSQYIYTKHAQIKRLLSFNGA
ncbi:hypothetical protein [Bacillus ndiopicus]|uniref:hypothetical protein n=1 Tax=Bacillus ndiopicus TaxID=1347368 RepID=UPI0005A8FA17|nr:hypothetical protein [Bacillus ndiopicus]